MRGGNRCSGSGSYAASDPALVVGCCQDKGASGSGFNGARPVALIEGGSVQHRIPHPRWQADLRRTGVRRVGFRVAPSSTNPPRTHRHQDSGGDSRRSRRAMGGGRQLVARQGCSPTRCDTHARELTGRRDVCHLADVTRRPQNKRTRARRTATTHSGRPRLRRSDCENGSTKPLPPP